MRKFFVFIIVSSLIHVTAHATGSDKVYELRAIDIWDHIFNESELTADDVSIQGDKVFVTYYLNERELKYEFEFAIANRKVLEGIQRVSFVGKRKCKTIEVPARATIKKDNNVHISLKGRALKFSLKGQVLTLYKRKACKKGFEGIKESRKSLFEFRQYAAPFVFRITQDHS